MPRVAYVGGYWSTNVGNGFFNLGADYVLKEVFGDQQVSMVFDQSAYITQWDTAKGNIPWAIDYNAQLDIDYMVLLGPVLSRNFLAIWKDTLIQLHKKGTRYMLLSTGMMKYSQEDIDAISAFFREYPPYVLTSRDRETYRVFGSFATHAYDGICFAFFVPDAYRPMTTSALGKNLVLNFDKTFEPRITLGESSKKDSVQFRFGDTDWHLKFFDAFSRVSLKTDRITDALVYALSVFPRGKRPNRVGDYTVIRTDHRFAPMFLRKVFRYPHSFCADIPHTYANIYSQADLTLSDRVHACAITLAYGNAAMLFAKTDRDGLLDRVGATDITKRPVTIDLEQLEKEKKQLIRWLKEISY